MSPGPGSVRGEQARAERVFLGWDRPLLAAAAEHLLESLGADLGRVIIAVPGARAGRRLLELLVDRLPDGAPPTLITAGRLVDQLLTVQPRPAGRATRTHAWAAALTSLPADRLAGFVPHPPAPEDLGAWRELGALARGLHGTLAAAHRQFGHAAEAASRLCGPLEARRWQALELARQRYLARLAEHGLDDPHEARRSAVDAGSVRRDARVVLVGVVEASGLLRAALSQLSAPPLSLVFAPPTEAARFDGLGCVLPLGVDVAAPVVPVDTVRWFVEDRPADQAERVLSVLASAGELSAADISIGLLDAQVGPPLARRLHDHGVRVRDVAGTPLSRTAPVRLLEATAAWLSGRSASAFAALLRHPDLPLPQPRDRCLVSDLDDYRAEHLPATLSGPWLAVGQDDDESSPPSWRVVAERDRRRTLSAARRALDECLGELSQGRARLLSDWVPALRAWLTSIYGGRRLQPMARESDRVLRVVLQSLSTALDELAAPGGWARPVSAAVALAELHAALGAATVPPAPDADAVELLGWLELPLDDAPQLVITGVNDGRLPEPAGQLADALATELGLPDDNARHTRDALLLTQILRSRQAVWLVTGRRSLANDALRPSRLLFACDDEPLLERVERFVAGGVRGPSTSSAGADSTQAERPLPRAARAPVVERMAVTAFKSYLASPYRFYLERVLRLSGADDGGSEMDPLVFGSLAHAVLEGLAGHAAGASNRPAVVDAFLQARLTVLADERFGTSSLPAVVLQVLQLRARLTAFSHWQAAWAGQGWAIRYAEWKPSRPVTIDVDGLPFGLSGSIDRIDENVLTKRWAILDYKSSETAAKPGKTHRKKQTWVDLQLPLYRVLAAELGLPEDVQLGYVNLPAELEATGVELAPQQDSGSGKKAVQGWTPALLDDALEVARSVIRRVRAGEFFELGDFIGFGFDEPLLSALAGLSLHSAPAPALEDEGDETDDEGAT